MKFTATILAVTLASASAFSPGLFGVFSWSALKNSVKSDDKPIVTISAPAPDIKPFAKPEAAPKPVMAFPAPVKTPTVAVASAASEKKPEGVMPVVAAVPVPVQKPVVAAVPAPVQKPVVAAVPAPVQKPVVAVVPAPVQTPVVTSKKGGLLAIVAAARALGKSADVNEPVFLKQSALVPATGYKLLTPANGAISDGISYRAGKGDLKDVYAPVFSGYRLGPWNTNKLSDTSNMKPTTGDSKDLTTPIFAKQSRVVPATGYSYLVPPNGGISNGASLRGNGDLKDVTAPVFSGYRLGSWNTRKLADTSNMKSSTSGDSKDVSASVFYGNNLVTQGHAYKRVVNPTSLSTPVAPKAAEKLVEAAAPAVVAKKPVEAAAPAVVAKKPVEAAASAVVAKKPLFAGSAPKTTTQGSSMGAAFAAPVANKPVSGGFGQPASVVGSNAVTTTAAPKITAQ